VKTGSLIIWVFDICGLVREGNTTYKRVKVRSVVFGELNSRSKGHRFKSQPIMDENGFKTMPESIPVFNPGIKMKRKKIRVG